MLWDVVADRDWEKIGLLHGLSEEHKKLCSFALNDALDYVLLNENFDEKLKVELVTVEQLVEKKDISISDVMKLFGRKHQIEVDLSILLFPMIRRVIAKNEKPFVLNDFLNHCRTHIRTFNPRKYGYTDDYEADWEAEVAAYLSDTY